MSVALAFSGKIASGKSTLSQAVAAELGWQRVSFGNYVRKLAKERGMNSASLPVLQALGADMVCQHLDEFCAGLLREVPWRPGQPLVIDGLRHVEVAERLRSLVAPSVLFTVHIVTDRTTRENRFLARETAQPNSAPLDVLDSHATEAQTSHLLPDAADLIVNGTATEAALVRQVIVWIRSVLDALPRGRVLGRPLG